MRTLIDPGAQAQLGLDSMGLVELVVQVDNQRRHLLLPRVQIASHECHGLGLLSVDAVDCAEGINSAEGPFS